MTFSPIIMSEKRMNRGENSHINKPEEAEFSSPEMGKIFKQNEVYTPDKVNMLITNR
jgi:hypothetical protein